MSAKNSGSRTHSVLNNSSSAQHVPTTRTIIAQAMILPKVLDLFRGPEENGALLT